MSWVWRVGLGALELPGAWASFRECSRPSPALASPSFHGVDLTDLYVRVILVKDKEIFDVFNWEAYGSCE